MVEGEEKGDHNTKTSIERTKGHGRICRKKIGQDLILVFLFLTYVSHLACLIIDGPFFFFKDDDKYWWVV